MTNFFTSFAALFGVLVFTKELFQFIYNVFGLYLLPGKKPRYYGTWSLITGATDGIGKAVAFELAKNGQNLVLVSRTQSKLEDTKKEIISKYANVQVELLAIDFCNFTLDLSSPDTDASKLKAVFLEHVNELGILVNNVGMGYSFPQYFDELTNSDVSDLISLNVSSTTFLTKLFLNSLTSTTSFLSLSSAQKHVAVINVGSFAGLFPSPLLAEYSAAKSFIERLTESLSFEYSSVDFQCHVPLYIVSKMSKFKKPSLMVPSAESYAKSIIENLGKKQVVVSGNLFHRIATELVKFVPESLYLNQVKNMHLAIRQKALRKLANENKQN